MKYFEKTPNKIEFDINKESKIILPMSRRLKSGRSLYEKVFSNIASDIDPFKIKSDPDAWKISRGYYIDERKKLLSWENMVMPYHKGLGFIVPGVTRCVCYVSELGYGTAILRIRTTDREPDRELVEKLQEGGLRVSISPNSGTFIHYPGIGVKLTNEGEYRYYEIRALTVPKDKVIEAMDALDLIGKVFLQAKEMIQARRHDSDDLADLLRMRKFPIAMEEPEAIRNKAGAVVSRLAREYMMNPGAMQNPMVQFLEVGDLADIAQGNKPLQDELRQKVKEIMGWQMTQNAGRMTVMDYLPIQERICEALGIPVEQIYSN